MARRFIVEECFSPHLGFMSQITDTQTGRKILVAGRDHQAKAERRAASLERGEAPKEEDRP